MSGVFLYDGECRFCSSSARWLQRHAASTARVSAWQHADLAALGLSADDCAEAVLWVEDGRREAGPDAVAAYLRASSRNWRGYCSPAPASTWPTALSFSKRWACSRRST